MIWLSTLACSETIDNAILECIALFYTAEGIVPFQWPNIRSFNIVAGRRMTTSRLKRDIHGTTYVIHNTPEAGLVRGANETRKKFGARKQQLFEARQAEAISQLCSSFKSQWPCESPQTPVVSSDVSSYIDVQHPMEIVRSTFRTCFENLKLFEFLQMVERTVSSLPLPQISPTEQVLRVALHVSSKAGLVSMDDLFSKPAPPTLPKVHMHFKANSLTVKEKRNTAELESFIGGLGSFLGESMYERNYLESLKTSMGSLRRAEKVHFAQLPTVDRLRAYRYSCIESVEKIYKVLHAAITPDSTSCIPLVTATAVQ